MSYISTYAFAVLLLVVAAEKASAEETYTPVNRGSVSGSSTSQPNLSLARKTSPDGELYPRAELALEAGPSLSKTVGRMRTSVAVSGELGESYVFIEPPKVGLSLAK